MEEEECACREQQRADEEKKRADEGRVAEEVRHDVGGDEGAGEDREAESPVLHLEIASTVQCTTPKTKDERDATKGACTATW